MFYKRKRLYLVNREFQLKYTRGALVVGLVSTLMTMGLILFPLFYLDIVRFPYFVPPPFLAGMVLAALINFAFVTASGILTTHRIAGPMFSLVRHLHQIRQGQPVSELRVREDDDLKFVIRNVNEFLEFLSARTASDKAKIDNIANRLETEEGNAEGLSLLAEFREELTRRLGPREP